MSTSIPPTRDSDSEDEDYVLPARDESSSDESQQEANEQASAPVVQAVEDAEEKKRKRDALWADFQASVPSGSKPLAESPPKKRVKIEKKYRFAGEETMEVVEVDEDSPDAKHWPLWKDPNEAPSTNAEDAAVAPLVPPNDSSTSAPGLTPVSSSEPSTSNKPLPPTKKPGPRKPKTTLASLPSSNKAKKLTTLDKSAMDWQAHLQASGSGVQDELDANRRGGGYLEKVEFLQRVEDRKEENLDALKSTKRRRL